MNLPLSNRSDAQLLAIVWLLTLTVLGVGAAAGAVILLVWGAIGLVGVVVGTVVYVRSRRRSTGGPAEETR